eukprot:CAMPEP_0178430066 /NCGR_PEP_ID=MMETSP0689_2-20121128/31126_1 /TAXON_ID=160604 /ORGANISM="Amphidinium massartii, Strain CS-259" /LENGTH=65 /DNA_ID=CAMNT_0020051907 /DNA_START=416 /DNA_END=613 /DNA_ORIENTATION=+
MDEHPRHRCLIEVIGGKLELWCRDMEHVIALGLLLDFCGDDNTAQLVRGQGACCENNNGSIAALE